MRSFRRGSMTATSRSERDWTLLLAKGAAIFVSIHLNSNINPSFNWTEVWVDAEVTSTRAQSESLAGRVAQSQAPLLKNPNPVSLRMSEWDGKKIGRASCRERV